MVRHGKARHSENGVQHKRQGWVRLGEVWTAEVLSGLARHGKARYIGNSNVTVRRGEAR